MRTPKGTLKESSDLRSHPVVMLLLYYCTTTKERKRGEKPGMRITYFRSGHVTDVTSGHVTSGGTSQHLRKCDLNFAHILLTQTLKIKEHRLCCCSSFQSNCQSLMINMDNNLKWLLDVICLCVTVAHICESIAWDKHFAKNNATHVKIFNILYGVHELFRFLIEKSEEKKFTGTQLENDYHSTIHVYGRFFYIVQYSDEIFIFFQQLNRVSGHIYIYIYVLEISILRLFLRFFLYQILKLF